jgi:hypothetical protein
MQIVYPYKKKINTFLACILQFYKLNKTRSSGAIQKPMIPNDKEKCVE